jgi:hypothetical protein
VPGSAARISSAAILSGINVLASGEIPEDEAGTDEPDNQNITSGIASLAVLLAIVQTWNARRSIADGGGQEFLLRERHGIGSNLVERKAK